MEWLFEDCSAGIRGSTQSEMYHHSLSSVPHNHCWSHSHNKNKYSKLRGESLDGIFFLQGKKFCWFCDKTDWALMYPINSEMPPQARLEHIPHLVSQQTLDKPQLNTLTTPDRQGIPKCEWSIYFAKCKCKCRVFKLLVVSVCYYTVLSISQSDDQLAKLCRTQGYRDRDKNLGGEGGG